MTQLSMLAEWEGHERCIMAWPGEDLVSTRLLTAAKTDYALVARAVSRFEPLLVVARPGFGQEAAATCGSAADVVELPFGEAWLRDAGPIFARRGRSELVAVDFLFNGWGESLMAAADDALIGTALSEWLGIARLAVPMVLEGGAIATDGDGTLLALEPTVRHENRNPGMSRVACEEIFRDFLGVERTIWLQHGLVEDLTDGHVDNVAAFVGPARVLCQTVRNRHDPNYERLAANRRVLENAVDARGGRLEVVDRADHFLRRYTLDTLARLKAFARVRARTEAEVRHGDARVLELTGGYDAVVTSPPYPGLIDYHEQHRYAYELLGLDDLRDLELGAAAGGTSRAALARYVEGVAAVLARSGEALRLGGTVLIVVNDRRELYPELLDRAGLELTGRYRRHVNRRTGRRAGEYFEDVLVARPV